ncbi:hypothetical protein [Glycomyces tenuis]|uniref:hypothetical protein n=1 Tax=Glycomyces tenuis TaxID=58116 RepID=UPI000425AF0B|nr:hypothetical protein [Glycomyces tenuis]
MRNDREVKKVPLVFAVLCGLLGLVLLFFSAPGEEEVLVFDGNVVQPYDECVVLDYDFFDGRDQGESGDCRDIADREVREHGWRTGPLTYALASLLVCAMLAWLSTPDKRAARQSRR